MIPLRQISAVLGLLVLAACSGAESRKASFVKKGEALMAERNYSKARLEFRNALQIDPDDARLQALAAAAAEQSGEYREAAGLYRAALSDPDNVAARAGLAKLFIFSGAPDEARKLVDEGLARKPAEPSFLAIRGATRMLRSDPAGARRDAEAALKAAPDNEDAAALLASLYAQAGQTQQAISLIERLARSKPQSVELSVILAQLYTTAGRKADAEKQLVRVVELEPRSLPNRFRLAQFQALAARKEAAEATLREAVRVFPREVDAKLALASFIVSERSFEAGEKSLRELVREDPDDAALQMGLGRFYETHERLKEAEGIYRAILKMKDAKVAAGEARNRLAALALKQNRADDARVFIDDVLKANPRDSEALVMRANLALARGDAPAAITDLRAVLRDQPYSQNLMRALARSYQVNGDGALAEETLRSAMQANPRDVATRLAIAKLLIDSGRAAEAQPVVDQLVADQPGDLEALEAAFKVQVARRDLAAARQTAANIRTLRPDMPVGYYLSGLVEEADGKADAARTNLEKAVSLSPEAVDPLAALMRLDIAQKKSEGALARVDAAIARRPDVAIFRHLRAETLSALHRWDEAIVASEAAVKLSPKWWSPYRTLAIAEIASGKRDSALATYRRGIEATGGAPVLVTDLASLYERGGRSDLAIAEYESWLAREPRSDVAANNLAMLLVNYRGADQAARSRALQLAQHFQASSNPAFLDTYAWVRYVRGEYNEAVPVLQRAVDLAPRFPALRARLGLAQKAAGQREAALENLELAVNSGAHFAGIDEARAALAELKSRS